MNNKTEGVILAGGEGSRMKPLLEKLEIPKHLLPVGNETSATRLARQLKPFCDKIFCVAREATIDIFKQRFAENGLNVEVIGKVDDIKPFVRDFEVLQKNISQNSQIMLIDGDLVFSSKEISHFCKKAQETNNPLLCLERKAIFKGDFAIRCSAFSAAFLDKILEHELNPNDWKSLFRFMLKIIFSEKPKITFVNTIANLNTPEQYYRAKKLSEKNLLVEKSANINNR